MNTIWRIFALATCIGVANADLVDVEVFGWVSNYPADIDGSKPKLVGDLQFLCRFTYEDQTRPSVDGIFRNAVKAFRIDFSGGQTIHATSGHIQVTSNDRLLITSLFNHNFPKIGNWSFNGNINFHLKSDGMFPWFALPTSNELSEHFGSYYTWINGDSSFRLGHTSMKVNTPSAPMVSTWLQFRSTVPDTFSWRAREGVSYDVYTSTNLSDWTLRQTSLASSELGSYTFDHKTLPKLFIRVKETP